MKALLFAILGIGLTVGPFVLGHPVRDLRNWRNASSWEPVQATVVAVSERRVGTGRDERREVNVRYTYTYQGKAREERYSVENATFRKLPAKGEELTIRVNPRDPSDALFNPEVDLPLRAALMFLISGFGLWILWKVFTGKVDEIPVSFSSSSSSRLDR